MGWLSLQMGARGALNHLSYLAHSQRAELLQHISKAGAGDFVPALKIDTSSQGALVTHANRKKGHINPYEGKDSERLHQSCSRQRLCGRAGDR